MFSINSTVVSGSRLVTAFIVVGLMGCATDSSNAVKPEPADSETAEAAKATPQSEKITPNMKVGRAVQAAKEMTVECKTPGVMDSGYQVKIVPNSRDGGKTLYGTIATVSTWGAAQKLYEGPFSIHEVQNKKNCFAELRGEGKGPAVMASAAGNKSTMILNRGGKPHEVVCKFPKPMAENLAECESELKTNSL